MLKFRLMMLWLVLIKIVFFVAIGFSMVTAKSQEILMDFGSEKKMGGEQQATVTRESANEYGSRTYPNDSSRPSASLAADSKLTASKDSKHDLDKTSSSKTDNNKNPKATDNKVLQDFFKDANYDSFTHHEPFPAFDESYLEGN